jgi:hypothetical protein
MGFFTWLWSGLTKLVGLIVPFFAHAADFRGWSPALRWTVRLLLLALLLLVLYYVNNYTTLFNPERMLRTPIGFLHRIWMPILGLLLILLGWLGWWLWQLLTPDPLSSNFPDIDLAWQQALDALHHAQLDLRDAPIFLVLGRVAAGEAALFKAAQLPFSVEYAPDYPEAPLHVYANRDAIFITCAGACLMGKQAAILAGEEGIGLSSGGASHEAPDVSISERGDEFDPMATVRPDEFQSLGRQFQTVLEVARRERRSMTRREQRAFRLESGLPVPQLRRRPDEIEMLSARLAHLCRLIVRDRHPYCPINGLLLLVPLAAADHKQDSEDTTRFCRQDLIVARSILQIHCPILALVCDLETAPGFDILLSSFKPEVRGQRVGQRYPFVPDLKPEQVEATIRGAVHWIAHGVFPSWIFRFFRVEGAEADSSVNVFEQNNTKLFRLMCHLRDRQERLGDILSRGVLTGLDGPPMFGGCYLAATDLNIQRQAFVPGVFQRLVSTKDPADRLQDLIAWTKEAELEEEAYLRWTTRGYISLGVFAVICMALAYLLLLK